MWKLVLTSVPVLVGGLVAAGVEFQRQGVRRDARRFPQSGRFVKTTAGSFHLKESHRQAGVTVVLESGLAGSSLSWDLVQREVAQFATVCSYDRAGFGWSSPSVTPRTLDAIVSELGELLEVGGIDPPYILVGHSYGGLIVRAYAHRHPERTAGLVLVDPVSTGYWADCGSADRKRLARGTRLARRGALLARLGIIRAVLQFVVVGRAILPQTVARISAPGAVSFLKRLTREIQKLPPALWPEVRAQWSRPMGFRAIAAYLAALQENCMTAEAEKLRSAVPTYVLSAATATSLEVAERDRWLQESPAAFHLPVRDSGHWIQVERPEVVIEAIRQMVNRAR